MNTSPRFILLIIALVLAMAGLIWPRCPLTTVSVILICVAELIRS